MDEIIKELVKDKNILILGYGREGRSSLKKLLEIGEYKTIAVADAKDISDDLPEDVSSFCGSSYMDFLDSYDVVFKSPGIVLGKPMEAYSCEFTSQTELFIRAYRNQIVGITGTKGKSTTSSLLWHVLKEAGKDVLFAGNIGIPVFDIAKKVTPRSVIVIELSCHQLENAKTAPHKSVLLNIYEDHLDHYGTRENYARAKKNIYLRQSAEDILYTTRETYEKEIHECSSKTVIIDSSNLPISSFGEVSGCKLEGSHNLSNAAFVYMISQAYGITDKEFIHGLATFEPLPHRLQNIGTFDGVDYYDDSISTTVKSTISAIESVSNASISLLGGMERNIDYEELVNYLCHSGLSYIICMYESGARLFDIYEKTDKPLNAPLAIKVSDLSSAVKTAKEKAKKGEAVLLSPAAASYGHFKNFEERGDIYAALVKNQII